MRAVHMAPWRVDVQHDPFHRLIPARCSKELAHAHRGGLLKLRAPGLGHRPLQGDDGRAVHYVIRAYLPPAWTVSRFRLHAVEPGFVESDSLSEPQRFDT